MDREETILRSDLATCMRGYWVMTWHEDREINPGVPDVSYTFNGGKHETGWLELKAIPKPPNGKYKFTLEPSQHRWMTAHVGNIPIHLLLACGDDLWLVDAAYHQRFIKTIEADELDSLNLIRGCSRSDIRGVLLPVLRKETNRSRKQW
jgi:hypothetical protein